ncbi:MAG: ASCH domain-containing protein [Bryobacteraceae bacterium]
MVFTKSLREAVKRGDITCSVRIWTHPHVKAGGRYPMEEGEIEVVSIRQIDYFDITHQLARESGFADIDALLKVAKHGKGQNVYVVRFVYLPPRRKRPRKPSLKRPGL